MAQTVLETTSFNSQQPNIWEGLLKLYPQAALQKDFLQNLQAAGKNPFDFYCPGCTSFVNPQGQPHTLCVTV